MLTGTAHRVTVAFRKSKATDTTQGGVTATFDCSASDCVETRASYFAVDRAGVRLARTSPGDYIGKRSEGDAFLHLTLTFHLVITTQAGVLTVSSPSVFGGQENGSSESLPAITTTLTGTWTRS